MANIKRNLVYNFVLSVSQVLLPLLSIPYVSRVLDPDGIGRVGFIDSFTYYFIIIAELGITVYGIRAVARQKNDPVKLSILISELLILHFIASVFTLVVYSVGIFLLWERIGDTRLVFFSVSFLFVNFFACDWYFLGMEQFRWITIRNLVVRTLGLVMLFLLVEEPSDYYIYYAIIAVSAMVITVWNILIIKNRLRLNFRGTNWKRHLKFVWVTYLINIFYSVPLLLDNVLLGLVSTATVVGFYSFSMKMVRTGANLLTDSFLVFFPRIVSLSGRGEDEQLREKLFLNIQFVILVSIPMGTGIYLLADDLAQVFLGSKFATISDNLKLLAVFPFLKGVSLFLSNPVLIGHDKEKNFLRNLVAATVWFVGAALVLGYYLADFGLCMALISTEIFLLVLNYLSVKNSLSWLPLFDFRSFGQAMLGSLLFVPIVFVIGLFEATGWLRLLYCIIVCIIVYGFFLLLVKNSFAMQIKKAVTGLIGPGSKES